MTVETASDRAAYLADWGVSVTGDASFTAIYDHEFIESQDIIGERPVLVAPYRSPVSSLVYGDSLTVDSTSYNVIRVESDGTGWCQVILEEQ